MDEHLKKIREDVDLMNKSFDEGVVNEPVATDPPVDDVKTDPPTTDESKTEPPSTDPPEDEFKTDPPKTDAPTTDAPDDRDQIIEDLRAKLAEKDASAPKTTAPTTDAPLTFEEHDFLKDIDIEDVVSDPKKLNELLNVAYQKAVTDTRELGTPMPDISATVAAVVSLQKSADVFYNENEDLKPFKKVVATVFDDLIAENSDRTYAEVMAEVAPEVRKRLELPKPTKKSDKSTPPRLPRKKAKSGRTEHKSKPDPLQSELAEMDEALGR